MAKVKSLIRRYWTAWLLTVVCVSLIFLSHTPMQAALTKTTAFDTIDAWQSLAVATMAVGNAEDISGSYATIVYIEVALTNANAQSGVDVEVEISYADDDWRTFWGPFTGTAETPGADDLDEGGGAAPGDPTITLTDATTDDFDIIGRRWFIIHGTVANSESVRTVSIAGNVVTLTQDLMRAHVDAQVVWDRVDEWICVIPFAAAYVRVLVNNTDADATIHWRSYCSKVTSMN